MARRSVGAGCSHAHGVIKLFMLRAITRTTELCPGVRVRVVVDDVPGQVHGRRQAVAAQIVHFIEVLGHELEGRLKLKVNRDKTVVVVGPKPMGKHCMTRSLLPKPGWTN